MTPISASTLALKAARATSLSLIRASERAGWLRKRILLGAALCLLGIGLTAATVFSGLPVGVVFTGLIVVGFFTGGVALVVSVRRTVER